MEDNAFTRIIWDTAQCTTFCRRKLTSPGSSELTGTLEVVVRIVHLKSRCYELNLKRFTVGRTYKKHIQRAASASAAANNGVTLHMFMRIKESLHRGYSRYF